MKSYLPILLAFLLTSCVSSQRLLQEGRYHDATMKAVNRLQRNPTKIEEAIVLQEAYPKANKIDLDRIEYLKREGSPSSWDQVLNHYKTLEFRQSFVETVTPLNVSGRQIAFDHVDYSADIIDSKRRAAEFHYTKAKELMQNDDQQSNRKAYEELQQVKSYIADYEDVDALMKEAKFLGTSRIYIYATNETSYELSDQFMSGIISTSAAQADSWKEYYYSKPAEDIPIDYHMCVRINQIDMTPEKETDRRFEESKQVQDGFDYVKDEKGNVKKDSLGNDIKVPKYKTIKCDVRETLQEKMCTVYASVDCRETATSSLLKQTPVKAAYTFRHLTYAANGDLNALSAETRNKLGGNPVRFPTNMQMIDQTASPLRTEVDRVVNYYNREIIK